MGLTTRRKEQTVVAYCLEDSKVFAYFLDHFNGIPITGYRNARQHLQKAYSQKTASVTTDNTRKYRDKLPRLALYVNTHYVSAYTICTN